MKRKTPLAFEVAEDKGATSLWEGVIKINYKYFQLDELILWLTIICHVVDKNNVCIFVARLPSKPTRPFTRLTLRASIWLMKRKSVLILIDTRNKIFQEHAATFPRLPTNITLFLAHVHICMIVLVCGRFSVQHLFDFDQTSTLFIYYFFVPSHSSLQVYCSFMG